MKDNEYHHLVKELAEIKDLLGELLRRMGTMEYSGEVMYGQANHISDNHKKYLHLNLKRNEKSD
tara:strand:+ start:209 stop:400 length:192 start_codon:yes stop_codon:yes gene_type:complete